MPFRTIMKDLVESTSGATGAIFVDGEGEAVDLYSVNGGDNYHLRVIGAHKGIMLNLIHDAQEAVSDDPVRNVVIRMENFNVLMAPVEDGYFVVMTLESESPVSTARYNIRAAVEALRKAM